MDKLYGLAEYLHLDVLLLIPALQVEVKIAIFPVRPGLQASL
jgi:hypothetical protein